MRIKAAAGMVLMLCLSLTACMSVFYFNGSRIGNESSLVMEYSVFDGTDYQILELESGDIIHGEVISQSGKVSASLVREKSGEVIYREEDIQTSMFRIEIKETGSYRLEVTGENARGSLNFAKE